MFINLKSNPYPNGNPSRTQDFLEELIAITGKERGTMPISEENGGYEEILFNGSEAKKLNPPEEAVSCTMESEKLDGFQPDPILRFKENGTAPTAGSGFFIYHGLPIDIIGLVRLKMFMAINLNFNILLRVQYFKTSKS